MNESRESTETSRVFDALELLTQRVDRLERSNRLLKIINLVGVVAIIAITRIPITSAGPSGVINALQYNLFSRSGNLMATLGPNASGFPSLTFFDATGKRLIQVGQADDGKSAGLNAFDGNALLGGNGVVRAGFGVAATGAGAGLFDGNHIERVGAFITPDSSSNGLILLDTKSVVRAQITQNTDAKTNNNVPYYIGLNGTNGVGEAFLGQTTTLGNFVGLNDAKGKNRLLLSQNLITGAPAAIDLNDENGVGRVVMFEDSAHSDFGVGVLDTTTGICRACIIRTATSTGPSAFAGYFLYDAKSPLLFARGGFFEPLDDSGTFLSVNDASGVQRLIEGFDAPSSTSFVNVNDLKGTTRANLVVSPGSSNLNVNDVNGKPRASVFAQDSISTGSAGFELLDANFETTKVPRAGLDERLDGSNGFIFFEDATGTPIGSWFPPAAPNP